MKTKILSLFPLLFLLLVSTSVLANGRPTGIRISRLVSGGGTNVEMDVTVTATNRFYSPGLTFGATRTTVWLGNYIVGPFTTFASQDYANGDPLPWGIKWGDGVYHASAPLTGPSGGPFTGTFSHTYAVPGDYTVTVGDAYGPSSFNSERNVKGGVPFTGNPITGSYRYVWLGDTTLLGSNYRGDDVTFGTLYTQNALLAITATATVTTGTGIPALNIYGLLAMSLVLVGTGILVYRKPHRTAV